MAAFHLGLSSFLLLLLASLILVAESSSELKLNSYLLQDSIINIINANPAAGWKAGVNLKFSNFTVGQFKPILGARSTPQSERDKTPLVSHTRSLNLPKEFDARKAWPQCSTISKILDQDSCVEKDVMVGTPSLLGATLFKVVLSQKSVIHTFDTTGCSHPGCVPVYPTPKCARKCEGGNQLWDQSKHFTQNTYRIKSDPLNIMAELYEKRPVEAAFQVYEDFAHYKSGVYKHITGDYMGGHAVKLIGWGTSVEGEDYWLLANQWNRSWGDDGYFMIKRGTNECGIEDDTVADLPLRKKLVEEVSGSDSGRDAFI